MRVVQKVLSLIDFLGLFLLVKIVVEQDARLSVRDIASCTGISEGSLQTILKKAFGPEKGLR